MKLHEQLIVVSDAYCTAVGVGRKRVSTIVLNRGARLDEIAGGGDIGTKVFEKAMQWFDENWPSGTPWPAGVDRPLPQQAAE